MRLLRILLSLTVAYFLLQIIIAKQEPVMELTPVEVSDTCICFEYFYGNSLGETEAVFQTCEIDILDQLADSSLTVFTFELPCAEVFAGTRQVDAMSPEIGVAQVD
ncbi:MAG: hypothetical protein KTR30_04400 [Saprospiraceae bacterium]|nr:hypothetical protein [Saprospiraceae bacterium]